MNVITNTRNHKRLRLLSDTTPTKKRARLDLTNRPSETIHDSFTVKIVLTMTLKANDAEEARMLAQHVAAFVPDDANRLTEAFSPVLTAPDELLPLTTFEEMERNRATTRAEVVAVVPGIRG